ncbi:Protein phosphatase 2C (PP2C)-like protein [Cynara cardunculus var. scolymus]|uniref:Protein phosphatase 2C (PP2C)-like protein n=1 Tax=Cynara cardunculus var. scolymus TaxID=59895 RepID=A0A103XVG8_CYNCS|nr:Protein phosphatase 2C (PP2C)-like protein [Cynara cardunculus var. scolymus]
MGSMAENHQNHPDLVSLSALMSRELKSEKMEKPSVRYGSAAQSRKGEDYFMMKTDCQRVLGNPASTFSVFGALPRALVAVASVGDSRCILDTPGGPVSVLTVDHRLEENTEERDRVTASGGEVGRLNVVGGPELCNAGGRLIIASDGIWDSLSTRGLKDDTTCIVVDIIPPNNSIPPPSPPRKTQSKLRSLLFRTKLHGSASKLLGNDDTRGLSTSGLFTCAVCQVDLAASEGTPVHASPIFSANSKPWHGPFLCVGCRDKKDAMEGKRPSGIKVI